MLKLHLPRLCLMTPTGWSSLVPPQQKRTPWKKLSSICRPEVAIIVQTYYTFKSDQLARGDTTVQILNWTPWKILELTFYTLFLTDFRLENWRNCAVWAVWSSTVISDVDTLNPQYSQLDQKETPPFSNMSISWECRDRVWVYSQTQRCFQIDSYCVRVSLYKGSYDNLLTLSSRQRVKIILNWQIESSNVTYD